MQAFPYLSLECMHVLQGNVLQLLISQSTWHATHVYVMRSMITVEEPLEQQHTNRQLAIEQSRCQHDKVTAKAPVCSVLKACSCSHIPLSLVTNITWRQVQCIHCNVMFLLRNNVTVQARWTVRCSWVLVKPVTSYHKGCEVSYSL